jgi:hypothetical protein
MTPRIVTSLLSVSLMATALSAAVAQTPPAQPDNPPAADEGPRGPGPRGPGFGPGGPGRMGPGSGPGGMGPGEFGWGPGMMMGPGMMAGPGFMGGPGMMCNPQAAGLAGWRLRQVERAVNLSDAQRKALDDLHAASAKAAEAIAAACPTDIPVTSAGRLAFMEKRMDAMLQAIKTVRPAFDAFYNSLDDEQKARLDRSGPRGWGWRGPRRGER